MFSFVFYFLFPVFFFSPLQSGQPGTYILRQLYAIVGQVQFVLPHIYPSVQYEVYSQEPQLTVEPLSGLNLLHDSDNMHFCASCNFFFFFCFICKLKFEKCRSSLGLIFFF